MRVRGLRVERRVCSSRPGKPLRWSGVLVPPMAKPIGCGRGAPPSRPLRVRLRDLE